MTERVSSEQVREWSEHGPGGAEGIVRPFIDLASDLLEARNELDEIKTTHARIISEQCGSDEKHCACVPALRGEIERLKSDRDCDGNGMTCTHRAALKRCHDLLEQAQNIPFIDANNGWDEWYADVEEELLACDKAGECPTVAAQPGGVEEITKALRGVLAEIDYNVDQGVLHRVACVENPAFKKARAVLAALATKPAPRDTPPVCGTCGGTKRVIGMVGLHSRHPGVGEMPCEDCASPRGATEGRE